MRALHVITGLGVGGAEQQLRLLLRRMPMDCDVVTLTNPGPVADGIRADGRTVTHLGMHGNRDLGALPRLVRLIRHGRYDLVHTHLYRACVYGRAAARLAGVRAVVATEHSLGDAQIEGRPLTRSARGLYLASERLGHSTVAVSATVARRLRDWGVPGPRIELIPNGIEADRFRFDASARRRARESLGLPADAFVVGGVGRLVPGKRFDQLVRAVAEVPQARLLLVGDGPQRGELARLTGQLGITDRVTLCGERAADDGATGPDRDAADVPALLAAMDVFVSPSAEEAFGLAVLEALAAGLPVLHVTCPAIDELPPTDAPGARRIDVGELAAALTRAQHDHQAGAPRLPVPPAVDRYDIARSAERLMAVYARVAAPAQARPQARPKR
ncbi:glycosyltransferase [Streptomyces sp. 549]|uniref:glycosyltransferase n=1 Tax=Streptomyces sp. 549 TaxID=3049076 RepID=UPI0024C44FAB|nr:glycosyltransferase [Streptomyces sp. 549]MDK1473570.1 glycosyltransferase [Streptomyces sp. 549]